MIIALSTYRLFALTALAASSSVVILPALWCPVSKVLALIFLPSSVPSKTIFPVTLISGLIKSMLSGCTFIILAIVLPSIVFPLPIVIPLDVIETSDFFKTLLSSSLIAKLTLPANVVISVLIFSL